jgi:hypothetical protein
MVATTVVAAEARKEQTAEKWRLFFKGSNFFQLVARNLDTLILSHTFFLPFPPNTSPQILFFWCNYFWQIRRSPRNPCNQKELGRYKEEGERRRERERERERGKEREKDKEEKRERGERVRLGSAVILQTAQEESLLQSVGLYPLAANRGQNHRNKLRHIVLYCCLKKWGFPALEEEEEGILCIKSCLPTA